MRWESYGFRIVRTPILCGPNRATFTITGKPIGIRLDTLFIYLSAIGIYFLDSR